MSNKVLELNDSNFDSKVLKNPKLVVVDFWAPWCGPCKMLSPIIDELANEYDGKAIICKLNIDDNSQTPHEYEISSVPTILIFKNAYPVEIIKGFVSKDDLKKAIDAHI